MSERKVLNKYVPPSYDPEVGMVKGGKRARTVRLMAPFSMRCNACGEYIYKGKKFNARKENVYGEDYLGIRIFRFYIRCPNCAAEITYKTDPKNSDYACENGAKRNFEPWREAKEAEEKTKMQRLIEEENNPMKALENKTFDSKRELEMAEKLDEIRTKNARLETVRVDEVVENVDQIHCERRNPALALEKTKEQVEDDEIIRTSFAKYQDSLEISNNTTESHNGNDMDDEFETSSLKSAISTSTTTLLSKTSALSQLNNAPRKFTPEMLGIRLKRKNP